jgi:hypothetical protein
VVEGARLESVYTRKGIAGSNPALSAVYKYKSLYFKMLPNRFEKGEQNRGHFLKYN